MDTKFQKLSNSAAKYLLGAVLIFVPLFLKFPLFAIPGTYVAIRFEDLLLFILGLFTFIKAIGSFKTFIKDELTLAFLLFFGINLISLISGIFVTKTVDMHIGLLNYLRRAEYLIPFFAILTLFNPKELKNNLDYYIKILLLVVVVAFIYGLGQRYLAFPIIITQNDTYAKGVALRWTPGSHISSTFAGHYDLAAFMVLVLPMFITLFFIIKEKWNRFWLFLTVAGGLWLLVNSLSRISQVSYLGAVSVSLIIARKFKALAIIIVVSLILIGASSSLDARFGRVIDVFYQKIKSMTLFLKSDFNVYAETALPPLRVNLKTPTPSPMPVFEDRSTSIRLNVEWPRAIRAFEINPLLGTGYSSITLATDNDFLRMLGETGLLGFLAFTLVFVRIGKLFVKSFSNQNQFSPFEFSFIVGVFAAIIGTFISAFFIDLFEASKFATIFWFLTGYSVCLIRTRLNE